MHQARQLGRYQLLDRVAFGGMAEIYRAKTADAEGRHHLVAVKRVLGHLCEDEEFIQMLVDEAKITASLQHDNIARIYEFCRTDREYFIAMEYIDGKDVRALLEKARQGPEMLPEEHVARIGMEVGRALHAAHTQRDKDGRPLRIVHRDVSPSNILLSYRGEVKLCDFGIAKATLTRVQTKTGVIKGKVKYMSPEQAMGRKLDHRSDLFSLGTLLYEMLTLAAPFQAPTEIELIFAVRDARKRPVHELRPTVNPVLEGIVDRAMARSRSQRFQSGEELAQALESFLLEFHGESRRSQFGRFMRNAFSKEIDRELRMLEEYVIEGGRADDVGENLLADVLGPNAPYTQFTAAFMEGSPEAQQLKDIQDLPTGPKPLPQGAMALAPVGTMDSAQRSGAPSTGEPPSEAWQKPRASVPIVDPALLPRQVSPLSAGTFRSDLDAGWGPAVAPSRPLIQPPAEGPFSAPMFPIPLSPVAGAGEADAAEGGDSAEDFEGDLHAEQTRILTRAKVNAGLHEASTRIFNLASLPREMQQALQSGGPKLAPLSDEIHEAETAYLPRAREVDWSDDAKPTPETAQLRPPERRAAKALPRPGLPGLAGPASVNGADDDDGLDLLTSPRPRVSPTGFDGPEPTQPAQAAQAPQMPWPGRPTPPSPLQSGSVELSSMDVSFMDVAVKHPESDKPEPSVILSEEDLEAVD